MTNKPVAYMSYYIDEDGDKTTVWTSHKDEYIENQIPLYTHPVKELTDEEIMEVITMSHSWIDGYPKKYALDFARAILRKAQEK